MILELWCYSSTHGGRLATSGNILTWVPHIQAACVLLGVSCVGWFVFHVFAAFLYCWPCFGGFLGRFALFFLKLSWAISATVWICSCGDEWIYYSSTFCLIVPFRLHLLLHINPALPLSFKSNDRQLTQLSFWCWVWSNCLIFSNIEGVAESIWTELRESVGNLRGWKVIFAFIYLWIQPSLFLKDLLINSHLNSGSVLIFNVIQYTNLVVSGWHAPCCLGILSPLICSWLFRHSVRCYSCFPLANISLLACFLVDRMHSRIICTHHPRSHTHNSTMTSADGIRLVPSMTDLSNLEPKDTGHRPCQQRMIDSSSHELGLNWQIISQNPPFLFVLFYTIIYLQLPSLWPPLSFYSFPRLFFPSFFFSFLTFPSNQFLLSFIFLSVSFMPLSCVHHASPCLFKGWPGGAAENLRVTHMDRGGGHWWSASTWEAYCGYARGGGFAWGGPVGRPAIVSGWQLPSTPTPHAPP